MKSTFTILIALMLITSANAVYINQIFYDAEGSDDGKEWIELGSDSSENLENYSLHYASAETWVLIWQGKGYILDYITIGNNNTDYFADLNLGNTKGAIKLMEGNETVDLVGYGDSTLYQENPAVDVGSNKSLLRIGFQNDNSLDFEEAIPKFNSKTSKENFTITIKETTPSFEIIQISSINAIAGEEVEIEMVLNSNGDYNLEIAGLLSGPSEIYIDSFQTQVGSGENLVKIPLKIPKSSKAGDYSGSLSILAR